MLNQDNLKCPFTCNTNPIQEQIEITQEMPLKESSSYLISPAQNLKMYRSNPSIGNMISSSCSGITRKGFNCMGLYCN